MADLERSRADFERKARAVGAALWQLQQDVVQADMPVTAQREELGAELRKRRRLSGAAAPPAGQLPDWHVDMYEEKQRFNEAAEELEEKLAGVSQALARVHVTVLQARATVDAAKVEAAPLLGPERLAAAREARNGSCSGLLEMLGRSDLGRPNHAAVLGELSVAGALYTDSARIKKDRTCLKKFYIHAPAKLKQDPATLPRAKLESHGCKKSNLALGSVAHRGTCSETSGSLTPPVQIQNKIRVFYAV